MRHPFAGGCNHGAMLRPPRAARSVNALREGLFRQTYDAGNALLASLG
jgi:hypothetical protein